MLSYLAPLVFLAGIGHLIIVCASMSIPYLLNWREDLAKLRPLNREIFWTYAGYIFTTNLSLGLVSILAANDLVTKSSLALAISLYALFYWGVRLFIQLFIFDRVDIPQKFWYKTGDVMITLLFAYLTITYGLVTCHQIGWW